MFITVEKKIFDCHYAIIAVIQVVAFMLFFIMGVCSVYGKEEVYNKHPFKYGYNKIVVQKDTLFQKDLDPYDELDNAIKLYNQGRTLESINQCNKIINDAIGLKSMDRLLKQVYNYKGVGYKNIGNLFHAKKCYEIALEYDSITKYLSLNDSITDYFSLKNSLLINLLNIELEKRDYKNGLHISHNYLTDSNFKFNPTRKAIIQSNLAYCASKLNDTLNANKYFNILLETIKNEKPGSQFDSIIVFRNYGHYLLDQNNINKSRLYLNKALGGSLEIRGENHYQTSLCFMFLGEWYANQNMLDSAEYCYNNAEKGLVEEIIPSDDGNVLWLISSYEMVFVELLQLRGILYNKMAAISKREEKREYLSKALEDYKLALDRISFLSHSVTDESSRFLIAKKGRPVIDQGIETAIELYKLTGEQEYFDNTLLWSIYAKSLSLKRLGETKSTYEEVGLSEDVVLELAGLRKNINDYIKKNSDEQRGNTDSLSLLIGRYDEKEREIREEFPNIKSRIDNISSVKKLMKNLRKETYIGFFELDSSFILLGLNSKQRLFHKIPKDSLMMNTIQEYKKIFSKPVYGDYTDEDWNKFIDYSQQMYKWFIQPFERIINKRKLVIHSDGVLLGIPFETFLPDNLDRDTYKSFKNLPYLFRKYNIRYTAGSILSNTSVNKIKRRKFSVGIIKSNNTNDLPGTDIEIQDIRKTIKNTKIYYLPNNKASAEGFVFNQKLLHISGHISVDFENPFNSGLSINEGSDSIIFSFQDILEMDEKDKIIYINGCESGTGQLNSGEGLMSMGLAFMMSGAKSIIQHFWKVNDTAASKMSSNFYTQLKRNTARDAMNKAREKYLSDALPGEDHPYYWASVVVYGQDWGIKNANWPFYLLIILIVACLSYLFFRKRKRRYNFLTSL
ncbi:CHAT domain-containing protein [Bacteroidota bacterium]